MKKSLILAAAVFLNAQSIGTLLTKIEKIPDTKIDNLMIKEMKTNKKSVVSSLYPKITLNASAEHFSRPNSLVPLPPTQSTEIIKSGGSLPFSKNIYRLGFSLSMPLFIKEIYENKKKMEHLLKATKYQAKINLLKRQSSLIIYISNLNYLYQLKQALIFQQKSVQTTYEGIKKGVEVGRIPEFKLLRLKDSLIMIENKISEINTKIADIQSKIYTLTNTEVSKPVNFTSYNVKKSEFFAIKPLKEKLKSSYYDINAKKAANYPKVMLKIQGNRSFAKAYNTNEDIVEDLASAGIYISWDIFNKKNSSEIQKAKIEASKTSLEIQKTLKDLSAQINYINASLKEIRKQLLLTKESITLKEELLKGAKVAFKLNTMTVDEYLKYEDDLVKAKAELANLIALKNTLIAQKALIYGKNLKKVFK
ncbi:TolC family protein [Nautilia lithotrophica]